MSFAFSNVGKIDESVLDTSQLKRLSMTFYQWNSITTDNVTDITIDISSLTAMIDTFNYNRMLETLVLKNVPETCNFTGGFDGCIGLKNLTITGTIGGTTFNLKSSKSLTKESIISVIDHLSTTATNVTATFSLEAVNKAFETSEGANDGSTSSEWITLIGTKSNWTIALA
jgi:hypothetical protein